MAPQHYDKELNLLFQPLHFKILQFYQFFPHFNLFDY